MQDLNETLSRLIAQAIRESDSSSPLPARIPPDGNLLVEHGLTSLTVVSLVMSIERSMGIEFSDEDLDADHFVSINTIVRLLRSRFPQCMSDAVEKS